jgi:hypothetical protein
MRTVQLGKECQASARLRARAGNAPVTDGRQQWAFDAGTKLADFVTSNRFCDIIMGPLGSGKSVAACLRIMRHAQEQKPSPLDGLRKTRWAIVRDSYPDLKRTTIRTWVDTFPEPSTAGSSGASRQATRSHPIPRRRRPARCRLPGARQARRHPEAPLRRIHRRLVQRAFLHRQGAVRRGDQSRRPLPEALRRRPDMAWDHLRHQPAGRGSLARHADRPGRPPPGLSESEMEEWTWPPTWGFHMQPPALIEVLDKHGNVLAMTSIRVPRTSRTCSDKYYANQIASKSPVVDRQPADGPRHPRRRGLARLSDVSSRIPRQRRGAATRWRSREVLVALDFGRMPAALFSQEVGTKVFIQHELQGSMRPPTSFAPRSRPCSRSITRLPFRFVGDPKAEGPRPGQRPDRVRGVRGLRHEGEPAPVRNNSIEERVEAVSFALNDNPSGNPNLVSSRRAAERPSSDGRPILQREGRDRRAEADQGNKYSHLCNACRIQAILGRGVGRTMRGLTAAVNIKPVAGIRSKPHGVRRRVG